MSINYTKKGLEIGHWSNVEKSVWLLEPNASFLPENEQYILIRINQLLVSAARWKHESLICFTNFI